MQSDQEAFYDKPMKQQKHPHFEHRGAKLYRKNNEFSEKKFQRVRRVSRKSKLVHSFQRIGKCLNEENVANIPTDNLSKVCLILINNYEHDKHDPKIGAMNDGYLIGLYHHRLGFKVFYLYNCESSKYPECLEFFLKYTLGQLTVFYSGRDTIKNGSHGIEFKDNSISCNEFGRLIADNYNGRCKAVFISDCTSGGSVFDIKTVQNSSAPSKVLSFYVNKTTDPDSKEGRRSHGIFTYYWCKILYECPNITPKRLNERMDASVKRFNENFVCECTDPNLENQPIFKD
ncbi:hypothetical protein M9Y10_014741 [Tritrichomonas musculus]|uniref:Caspase family p20 domain-containing protein n=1 Tax=Tritrichomonas musculus TaxID=1915356 RepID=A0ABR2L0C1_9EUKA